MSWSWRSEGSDPPRRGNGTGPGTPFAQRRGPNVGERLIRGPPEHFRSIKVRLQGRWFNFDPPVTHYFGGLTRYIHNINPPEFHMLRLVQALQEMAPNAAQPTMFWYYEHGDDLPAGLRVLTSDADIQAMWANCDQHGEKVARVYVQARDELEDPEFYNSYQILPDIPSVPDNFPAVAYHTTALVIRLREECGLGAEMIGQMEVRGMRWYLSTDPVPRAPVVTQRELRALPNRRFSNI